MEPIKGEAFAVQRDPKQMNSLALAYIGDSVYEVYVRQYVLARGEIKPKQLHRAAVAYVSAHGQARQLDLLYDRLNEEELLIVRRGRNAKSGTIPKNARPGDYQKATAFEALIGYLFLMGKTTRLHELIEYAINQSIVVTKEGES